MVIPRVILLWFLICASGCTLGYRRNTYASTVTRDDGRSIRVEGHSDNVLVMMTADFRYFRLGVPFEGGRTIWRFEDDTGARDSDEQVKERRFFRLDAPLISLFRPDVGWGVWYPGVLKKRKSLEIWVNGETDFFRRGHRWTDIGIMYYHYNSVALRLYGGIGSEAFRASTRTEMGLNRIWDERVMNWGVGIEITMTAGEYFLELIEYLAKVDRRHQKRIKRNRY